MIKAPITKTGEIRYIEFIKIFFLVSFFIAFISKLTEQPQFFLQVSPVISINILNVIIILIFSTNVVRDLNDVTAIIASFVIKTIPGLSIHFKEQVMELFIPFKSIFATDLLQSKLCVVRC